MSIYARSGRLGLEHPVDPVRRTRERRHRRRRVHAIEGAGGLAQFARAVLGQRRQPHVEPQPVGRFRKPAQRSRHPMHPPHERQHDEQGGEPYPEVHSGTWPAGSADVRHLIAPAPFSGGLLGERIWRTGARWRIAAHATLGLEATRAEAPESAAPEHGIGLGFGPRW